MALSQKYTGKVLVPWFNTSEWRNVHRLLRSQSHDDHKTVLDVLKIWKTRTPLLSAGIEGTLILLEALHSDIQTLPESLSIQIYSISLLRFLNICAANNERQGTFSQSISRTDLPKWLIDIRHDIAHDNKMPSRSLLEIGLQKSLDWLIKSYWDAQNKRICDFSVNDESENGDVHQMQAYIKLVNIGEVNDLDEATANNIKKLIGTRHSYSDNDKDGLLSLLEETLNRFFSDMSNSGKLHKQLQMLVSENAMLAVKLDSSQGHDVINNDSRDIWTNVLNIVFNHGLIFILLKELYRILPDVFQPEKMKVVSALWIKEIVAGLLELLVVKKKLLEMSEASILKSKSPRSIARARVEEENESFGSCLKFHETNIDFSKDALEFRDIVFSSPNIHSTVFLKSLLQLTDSSKESTESWINLSQMYLVPSTNMWEDEIMTANHVDGLLAPVEHQNGIAENSSILLRPISEALNNLKMSSKWEKIQDTRPFERCPLGLLPHQSTNTNPLISF